MRKFCFKSTKGPAFGGQRQRVWATTRIALRSNSLIAACAASLAHLAPRAVCLFCAVLHVCVDDRAELFEQRAERAEAALDVLR